MNEIVNRANTIATKNNRYSYKSTLGKGSFGTVLKAYNKCTREDVAVKIIEVRRNFAEILLFFLLTPADLQQGRREVNLLRDLQHEKIVAFRDGVEFTSTTGLAIVMEYCPGGTFKHILKNLQMKTNIPLKKDAFHGTSNLHQL